ncbi:hypothetical protein GDO78_020059 [Eleutherodactylus coqui]|uniref:Protein phosphatase 1 regulatory subunit 26 N-terminal domain-containing protein n=1 Tax=Eleutherodactylus coqui TaxID=57060 RepID=A0A8J6BIW8_ELECQ|nr:hypothetical protein GDO78_020059 [Eleutherodactylus coqui]
MFLLDAPLLAAFQKQWTPFGCNAPCRVPTSLPQPAQVASSPVAADVEGTVDSPQSGESSLTVNLEYERIMQWNRKVDLNIDKGQKSSSTLFKGHAREKAALIVPVQFKDFKEESSDFRGLSLDSDSDDSVDRGIEEAIQEYLKNKVRASPVPCAPAAKSPNITENDTDKVKSAQISPPARKYPVNMVTSYKVCNSFTVESWPRCSSPDSVGSDDSFEQSINEEIEQFLIEKKLHNNAITSGSSKKAATSRFVAKPKPFKAADKPGPKQGIKVPTMKTVSESLHVLPITNKPKVESCKSNFRLKPGSGPAKPNLLRLLPPPPVQCSELSDSSSDDGIEEAIQLYQLEKSKLEGSLSSNSRTSLEKDGKSTRSTTSDISHCQMKKSPEPQVKTYHRKRKLPNVKLAASPDFTSKKTFHLKADQSHEYKHEVAATWRVETAAELMCAEAILDISKAILPSQPASQLIVSQDKLPTRPASPCPSDSSIDSDDSIEQEIRTYLAQKAQAESLGVTSAKQSPKEQKSEPPKRLPPCNTKTAGTSKGNDKGILKDSLEKGAKSLNVDSSPVNSALTFSPSATGKTTESYPDYASKHHHQAEDAKHHIIQVMESLESSPGATGGKRKMFMKVRSGCSGDKSSSLDSDEDLDSAIKDLLRSKRKCKKRPKDGRPQCKKKVRFGETTTRPLETVGGTEQDCKPKSLVKSCLVISNDPKDTSFRKSKTNVKLKDERKAPVGNTELSAGSKPIECKPARASDKPVKISSALPDAQDSSSVDSDDSIEQEIRKFLADRARESADRSVAQRTTSPVITATVTGTKTTRACTVSSIPVMKEPACTDSPASVKQPVCTVSPTSVREPACTVSPASVREPACTVSPAFMKKEAGVLSSSVTETILQKVREKDRSAAPATQPAVVKHLYGYKDPLTPVASLQKPTAIASAAALHSVIVKRECILDQSKIARPAEVTLPKAPDRVLVKTGVNSSQGNIPISGNFVAGLKYISGTEQQLLLNVGKTGTTRLATDFYNPGGPITQLGNCQAMSKKTLLLEQPKVVQAPAFSLGAPMVRPALYVVTTKVVQEASASLCLPINAATYDTGLNLMSIQYCPSQVAPHTSACTAPFSFQQALNNETMVITPGKAGELPTLITQARPSEATSVRIEGESKFPNVTEGPAGDLEAGASMLQKDEVQVL